MAGLQVQPGIQRGLLGEAVFAESPLGACSERSLGSSAAMSGPTSFCGWMLLHDGSFE